MAVLTVTRLCREARIFSSAESAHPEPSLFGVTDGKAVGTYLEAKFRVYLAENGYSFEEGNEDDLMAFMVERHLTADEIELNNLAAEVLANRPEQGYLTISPAMQWRLQYKRVIAQAGGVDGVRSVYKGAV